MNLSIHTHTHTHTHTQLAFEGGGAALAFNYVNATSGTEDGGQRE